MHSFRLSFLTAVMFLPVGGLFSQTSPPATGAKPADIKIVGPGLTLYRFPLHASQATADNSTGYVPYANFGKPLKAPRTVTSLSKWEKPVGENAIVMGFIEIEKAGTYHFRTGSNYDRNELIIDGKIVCAFRDGEDKGQTVQLKEGLLPIVCVGFAMITTEIRVQWMPPGETTWQDIPNKLLGHEKAKPAP